MNRTKLIFGYILVVVIMALFLLAAYAGTPIGK